jgi:hypothetical protein
MSALTRRSAIAIALAVCVALAGNAEARRKKGAHKHKTPAGSTKAVTPGLSPDLEPEDEAQAAAKEGSAKPEHTGGAQEDEATTPPPAAASARGDEAPKDAPAAESKSPAPAVTVDEDGTPAAKPRAEAPTAMTLERKQETEAPPVTVSSHAWLWATLGVLVAAGAVGAYVAFRPHDTVPPNTQLGNYRF